MTIRSFFYTFVIMLVTATSSYSVNHICTGESFAKIISLFTTLNAKVMETHVDLSNCNPELLRSKPDLEKFLRQLRIKLNAAKNGSTSITHSAGDNRQQAGYTATEHIERGTITVLVNNSNNGVFLNVNTFQPHNPYDVARLAEDFFHASKAHVHISLRSV